MCAGIWDSPVQRAEGLDPESSVLERGPSVTWSESLYLLGSLSLYLWNEEVGLDSPGTLLSPTVFPDPTRTLCNHFPNVEACDFLGKETAWDGAGRAL